MDELIKVTVKNDHQLVSARDLYKGLGISRKFSLWAKDNFKNFIEHEDFEGVRKSTPYNAKSPNGKQQEIQDYALTISMAKELSMMSHTDQGKKYRKYFIELERKWNDPIEVVKRGYSILNNENAQLKIENTNLKVDNQLMKPKADYFDDIVERKTLSNFRDTAKMLNLKQKQFINWLLDHKYVFRDGHKNLRPYHQYAGTYFVVKDTRSGFQQTMITAEGREAFNLLIVR